MSSSPSNSFLLTSVRIFTGTTTILNGSIYVSNGHIKHIHASSTPFPEPLPPDLPILDKPGHTVLPGLIDAHIHASYGNEAVLHQAIRFGVTAVLDMHNEPRYVQKLKKLAESDKQVADFKSSGFAATIEGGWPSAILLKYDDSEEVKAEVSRLPTLTTPESGFAFVESMLAQGASYIKLYQESGRAMGLDIKVPSPSLQASLVNAAHKHNVLAVAHALALDDAVTVLNSGVDGMVHTIYDQSPTQELVEAYKKNNVFCIPTLAIIGSLTGELHDDAGTLAKDERVVRRLDKREQEKLGRCVHMTAPGSSVEFAYESVRVLKDAGVDILVGSDAAGPTLGTAWGLSTHHELFLLVHKVGFTPTEALRAATSITARRFGLTDRGSIEVGKKADLILVKGDPTEKIEDTLNLEKIWRDGVELVEMEVRVKLEKDLTSDVL